VWYFWFSFYLLLSDFFNVDVLTYMQTFSVMLLFLKCIAVDSVMYTVLYKTDFLSHIIASTCFYVCQGKFEDTKKVNQKP